MIARLLAAIDHFEIPLGEVLHESPFSVPDRGAHGDKIDTGTERGLLVLCGPLRPPHEGQCISDREGEEDPPHAPHITKFLANM